MNALTAITAHTVLLLPAINVQGYRLTLTTLLVLCAKCICLMLLHSVLQGATN